jgi:TonB family protein
VVAHQVKAVGPEYSYEDRRSRNQGAGVYRLVLDAAGAVTDVAIIKSTGVRSLDHSAITALQQWRWQPGKWKQIEMPITFTMDPAARQPPPGAIRLPKR